MSIGWIFEKANPYDLRNNPINQDIYGTQQTDAEMLESIGKNGVFEPIRIMRNKVILSGHRRMQHARVAGLEEVPVLVCQRDLSEAEQVVEIVESNRQREKTTEQRAREFSRLAEAEAELAKKRQAKKQFGQKESGQAAVVQKFSPPENTEEFEEKQSKFGKSKAIAAAKVGMSRPTAERAAEVVKEIDRAEASGDRERAGKLREKLNTESVAAAHREVKPPAKKTPTDRAGTELPDRPELRKAFESSDLFASCEKARTVISENCVLIGRMIPDGPKFRNIVDKMLKALFATINEYRPGYVCKACNGGGCQKCQKKGYLRWESK